MVGADLTDALPPDHREALLGASQLPTDRLFDDLVKLSRGRSPGHAIVAGYVVLWSSVGAATSRQVPSQPSAEVVQ